MEDCSLGYLIFYTGELFVVLCEDLMLSFICVWATAELYKVYQASTWA